MYRNTNVYLHKKSKPPLWWYAREALWNIAENVAKSNGNKEYCKVPFHQKMMIIDDFIKKVPLPKSMTRFLKFKTDKDSIKSICRCYLS